jgi:single-strand DNA-binding protein
MGLDFNDCHFTGHLGRDPEHKFTQGGQEVTNFSIAVNESYSTKDGDLKEKTLWLNVVAFDKLAELCYKLLQKGSFVDIKGSLSIRKYTGRDGTEKTSVEIIASKFRTAGTSRPKQEENDNRAPSPAPTERSEPYDDGFGSAGISDDDIPF